MSINRTEYVIWGIKLPYPEDQEDEWEERMDDNYAPSFYDKVHEPLNKKNDCVVLVDAYSSDYMIIGHVLDRTHGHEGSLSECPLILPPSPSDASSEELKDYARWMKGIEDTLEDLEIDGHGAVARWMVVHHYT